MSAVGYNFYGQPEQLGLTEVAELDAGGSYEFDKLTVWRHTDGKFWAASDSGCSCPTPYENHTWPTDFTEVRTVDDVKAMVSAQWSGSYYGPGAREVLQFIDTVTKVLG